MSRKLNVIGAKLRSVRREKELTQTQLAAKCGVLGWDVSAGTLAKVESHLRSAFDCELIILARALRVNVNDLLPTKLSSAAILECLNKPVRRGRVKGRRR